MKRTGAWARSGRPRASRRLSLPQPLLRRSQSVGARARRRTKANVARVKITQVRSQIGQSERHRGTLRALGLGKIRRSVEQTESPVLARMLRNVRHLLK